jgi:uncharacterized protein
MMVNLLSRPWPWYVVGAVLGAVAPLLLLVGNRQLGVSGSLRTICAAVFPRDVEFFRYDWKKSGMWNLVFALGIMAGGFIVSVLGPPLISPMMPPEIFSIHGLLTMRGFVMMVGGGFLVGFGAAYAGGCTSGHGISGVADFQLPSFIAVVAMFGAGVLTSWLIIPLLT